MSEQTSSIPGRIGILGGGSWATALAKIVLTKQPHLNWLLRSTNHVKEFTRLKHNPSYLTSVTFDLSKITFFTDSDVNDFFRSCDTVILATPSPYIRYYLKRVRNSVIRPKLIINAIKGMVPEENILISDYLQEYKELRPGQIAVIAGPCHAEEIAKDRVSYLTIGCFDMGKAKVLSEELFSNDFVHCAVSRDVVGIEYSAVLKNIYAIAAGICHGLNLGDNFQSVLISNAIAEMSNFVSTVHLVSRDVTESVYLGDLLVTAYSSFSRNRTFGNMIGKGYSVRAAQMEMNMVAEGYYAAKCIHLINLRYQVNMPICRTVYEILYEGAPVEASIRRLSTLFK
ncbi:NAD(P)H-dependent glycerol-3-phosphate dehydrogenase [Porphyromonas sp. oral taxon 278]|jgi:glycerol-3-phosphate dehydrogenase|uniref:NAD(P)H-dependent glycerol-3-phosphate dehydrogenase n=1 Tax=Porphyromonas sp. oral taxon 278 TaxID=712437 RepID=UPI0025FF59C3|nr:NAD(P)H-dependent glycerol-3-phosphate dehydrogenase [Porphyromonas sp. oral taxon 278]